jgi:hypothetical protein
MHMQQCTFNDVPETVDANKLFALGAFIRVDNPTTWTIMYPASEESKVRELMLPVEE